MNKYLLEIGTEELAYKFIPSAMEQLKTEFTKALEENEVKFSDIKVYATPRRLTVVIEDLPEKQEDVLKTIKGPIATVAYDENGNLTKAALGFANKNNISPENLFKQDNYVWAKIEQKGKSRLLGSLGRFRISGTGGPGRKLTDRGADAHRRGPSLRPDHQGLCVRG